MALSGACGRCPVCAAALWAPDPGPTGEGRCPRCGAELWALPLASGPTFFVRRPGQTFHEVLAAWASPRLGVPAEEIEWTLRSADSLDIVEFVMEVENAAWPRRG
jgi:hypothetical protein